MVGRQRRRRRRRRWWWWWWWWWQRRRRVVSTFRLCSAAIAAHSSSHSYQIPKLRGLRGRWRWRWRCEVVGVVVVTVAEVAMAEWTAVELMVHARPDTYPIDPPDPPTYLDDGPPTLVLPVPPEPRPGLKRRPTSAPGRASPKARSWLSEQALTLWTWKGNGEVEDEGKRKGAGARARAHAVIRARARAQGEGVGEG